MIAANGKIHPTDAMTSRERLLAAYQGREVDRLPYWAKVANNTWMLGQPERVRKMSPLELLDYIHADGILFCGTNVRAEHPHIRRESSRDGDVQTHITHTPDGDLREKWTHDPYTGSWHPTEFPVKTREDIGKFRWHYADVEVTVDQGQIDWWEKDGARIDPQRGIFFAWWGTSPLMDLVEHIVGPADTPLMLHDYPEEMDELIELMHQGNLQVVREAAKHSPADALVSGENTSTTLISPKQFEKYSWRHLCEYGRAIEAEGKMHEMHMCGHLKALLPLIDQIPGCSVEAYTSPTLGNTRLVDGRTLAPGKTLVGGTNVNVWLWPAERIKQYILDELAACPDNRRTVLTTAGVAPPGCPAEKFREIGEWIHTIPIRT